MNVLPRFTPIYILLSSDAVVVGVYSCKNLAVVAKMHYEKAFPKVKFSISKECLDVYDVEDYDIM